MIYRELIMRSPITSTWLGGAHFATDVARLKETQVTRQEYQEHGGVWASRVLTGNIAK